MNMHLDSTLQQYINASAFRNQ